MSVDFSGFTEMRKRIEALTDDMPKIMEQFVVGEGVYAVGQARRICTDEKIVNNGTYRMNFHAGDKALSLGSDGRAYDGGKIGRSGPLYSIDVYNNLDYAKHLEHGFRSHFVPAKYLSGPYREKFPNGMYVGPYNGFVNGRFVLKRAIRRTEQTQDARLSGKFNAILNQRINGKENGSGDTE